MPSLFVTSPTATTGRAGSRSFINYQIGGQDRVVAVVVQIDGEDQFPLGSASGPVDDLRPFSGMWFTQPAVGSHTLGVRIVTSFGCKLLKLTASPLNVKP